MVRFYKKNSLGIAYITQLGDRTHVGGILDLGAILLRRRRNLGRVPTTEEKPEVPFSRVLKRDPGVVFGTTFEWFCDWYLTFS